MDGRGRSRGAAPWMRHPRVHPGTLVAIAVGGAAGTCARVAVADALPAATGRFPWATFAVNVGGTLLLGFVMELVLERLPPTRLVRPLLATGVCGAFTTFSTLVTELDLQLRAGRVGLAATYLGATLACGLAAAVVGMMVARTIPRREA